MSPFARTFLSKSRNLLGVHALCFYLVITFWCVLTVMYYTKCTLLYYTNLQQCMYSVHISVCTEISTDSNNFLFHISATCLESSLFVQLVAWRVSVAFWDWRCDLHGPWNLDNLRRQFSGWVIYYNYTKYIYIMNECNNITTTIYNEQLYKMYT